MDDERYKKFVEDFRKGVVVKDRKYLFKRYEKCFVGSEAVDWIIGNKWATNREEAIQLGNNLLKK